MLHLLKIRNLALLDSVELEFDPGFITVTGETGAGKSILLGALSLLAGNRADKSIIRQGTDCLEVEAVLVFRDPESINHTLDAAGLPLCDEGQLLLKRILHRDKPARIYINGALATAAQLQELGEQWIDFHGPGEPQKLFGETYQLELFDLFAANGPLLKRYRVLFDQWRAAVSERQQLASADRLAEDEIEFMRKQISRISTICPDLQSIERLENDFQRLSRIQEIVDWSSRLESGLGGDEGIGSQLGGLIRIAQDLARVDPAAEEYGRRLEGIAIELQDLANEYGHLAGDADFDEQTVNDIEQRMQQWLELKRAYGPSVDAVLGKATQLKEKLDRCANVEATLSKMDEAIASVESELQTVAAELQAVRAKNAPLLAEKVTQLLSVLGFKKARFMIEVIEDRDFHDNGRSHCRFVFAPNPGQAPCPLNKIASSGETARVMLALKAILAEVDQTPLLVFDEVDANVGGEVGAVVGAELRRLAQQHQVLCVTHLPQVAAQGQMHLLVEKQQQEDSTQVEFRLLGARSTERKRELARMLGDRDSASALRHAGELLKR